ncbi:hypothetical protein, partial [uncultured Endozoicomonas sp.]|uniref:hypothetical protein n=1 Tax=uncultured Endozoicomonas sp. TaxID=432652 RepID=UPI00261AC736
LSEIDRWCFFSLNQFIFYPQISLKSRKNEACLSISSLPWRDQDTTTAGMMRIALSKIIPRFPIREGWNRYNQKYEFDFNRLTDQLVCDKGKAA